METTRERDIRIAWMEQHLGVPFIEMRKRSQQALADTTDNRRAMLKTEPKAGPLNLKFVDGLTAQIAARREKGK